MAATPKGWRLWLLGARPRTLPAAIVPVLVGTAVAVVSYNDCVLVDVAPDGSLPIELCEVVSSWSAISWLNAGMALIVALALQIGVNFANDYSDGKRGTDDPATRIGPPRLVGSGLASLEQVRTMMFVSLGVALVAGVVLVVTVGWILIPVGLACVAAAWFYTGGSNPYGYLGFGELFVFVFFGLVATIGSTYVQIERITPLAVISAVMVGLFASAILLVNNLRDIPGDIVASKMTLAVRLGDRRTRILYAALMITPFLLLPFAAGLSGHIGGALAFGAIPGAFRPMVTVMDGSRGKALIPALGGTARVQLIFGVLYAVGIVLPT
jgi:1,4-dihydroxy-2-naphthoate octaprenyltransferase